MTWHPYFPHQQDFVISAAGLTLLWLINLALKGCQN